MNALDSSATRWTFAVLAHIGLVLAWYLFVEIGQVPKFVMPSPQATLDALMNPNYSWWTNIAVTGTEIFGGYLYFHKAPNRVSQPPAGGLGPRDPGA